MKIAVIGGSGFLGSVFCKIFESKHKISIGDLKCPPDFIANSKYIKCNLEDPESIDKVIRGNDYVFHFAGLSDLNKSLQNPKQTIILNILGTLNVLNSCRKNKVKKMIFSSSIYADSEKGSFYKCSKLAAEKYIEEFHKSYGLNYTILRFGSLYGPYSDVSNGLYNILTNVINSNKFIYQGNKASVREYLHIYDAAKACFSILEKKFDNKIINLTGTEKIKMEDLKDTISEMIGKKLNAKFSPSNSKHHYDMTPYYVNFNKIQNYKSNEFIDFNLGLKETFNYVLQQKKSK